MRPPGKEAATTKQVKPVEGGAVQPVVGVSQRVRTGPKKKKDLGTMGKSCDLLFINAKPLLCLNREIWKFPLYQNLAAFSRLMLSAIAWRDEQLCSAFPRAQC